MGKGRHDEKQTMLPTCTKSILKRYRVGVACTKVFPRVVISLLSTLFTLQEISNLNFGASQSIFVLSNNYFLSTMLFKLVKYYIKKFNKID